MKLMFILPIFVLSLFGNEVHISPRQYIPYQSHVLPPSADSPLLAEYQRIQYAEELLQEEAFRFELVRKGKHEYISERPVILAAFDQKDSTWHTIHVAIPFPIPNTYFAVLRKAQTLSDRDACQFPVRALTSGYVATHIRGAGASRLLIRVQRCVSKQEQRELVVYRMKYPRIAGKPTQSFNLLKKTLVAQTYTPLGAHFETIVWAKEGEAFLRTHIAWARTALLVFKPKNGIAHQSLYGTQFPDVTLFALHISEQWDPLYFRLDRERSYKRILAEYGVNREYAFAWSTSSANAIGPLQFTNMHGNGTYAGIVRAYSDVGLVPSFEDGARDLHNVIKAAFCLLDYELKSDQQAQSLYLRNVDLAFLHPVAAYNGGGVAGKRIIQAILKLNKNAHALSLAALRLPHAILGTRKRKMNTETPMYIKKYIAIIHMTT